jgi:hypothetical protein
MDPKATAPTQELEQESPQEALDREQRPEKDEPGLRSGLQICRALRDSGALRNEELLELIGYEGDPEDWKRTLWRLHNEGFVKVRWVGLADPDPVEVRLADRGWALVAEPEDLAAESRTPGREPPEGGSTESEPAEAEPTRR